MKYLLLCLLMCGGCTVVGSDRVFPKMTWYWSKDAQNQRDDRERYKLLNEQYEQYDKTNGIN